MEKVNLGEKFALIFEHWRPQIIGELNGQEIKIVKIRGEFPWHHHEKEEAEVLLFEPMEVLNTGNIVDEKFTAPGKMKI